jgi:hypothetical protein
MTPELPSPLTMALLATSENGRDRNGSNDPTELRGIAAPAEFVLDRRRETPKADPGLQRVEAELARRAELGMRPRKLNH